ncbi:Druantia anti-phage system protein DruA [Gemmatimonas sp.]|uniref:Druantia anti-phage system protein DruA n=1 Tax=Gemmatimonas sp. TaxID=1962908 RepID=UPI0035619713
MTDPILLPLGLDWTANQKRYVRSFVSCSTWPNRVTLSKQPLAVRAALLVLRDLRVQGWDLRWTSSRIEVSPPALENDPGDEKVRVQKQERLKRDEQLAQESVRRFVVGMEAPREHKGRFVSVFSLMRDGEELAERLRCANGAMGAELIDPYLQFPDSTALCEHTGLRLMDVWRYFRHTWSNQYVSTPGRTMPVLVRDRAVADHPVIGIAALGSPIVQLAQRDAYLGWDSTVLLDAMLKRPTKAYASWLLEQLDRWLSEIYKVDLVADGLYAARYWDDLPANVLDQLRIESTKRREMHQRLARKSDFRWTANVDDDETWIARATSDLFRSKRCSLLADLLEARSAVNGALATTTAAGLRAALDEPGFRKAVRWIVRRSKSESVGTEVADLTVCGAVAPYNHVLGGKLVSVLAASPTVVRHYSERYEGRASEIASSTAGRRVVRPAKLVFLGTTSLYGAGSSQYNRIKVPGSILCGERPLEFERLGRSRSFGTSHLSSEASRALSDLAERSQNGARVKSIFGEGASPKLRRLREGMDELGWPSNELLQHRRERIVYGVSLAENAGRYLMRLERRPRYNADMARGDDVERLAQWWRDRWLAGRIESAEVLQKVEQNRTTRPVNHGARVCLPPL